MLKVLSMTFLFRGGGFHSIHDRYVKCSNSCKDVFLASFFFFGELKGCYSNDFPHACCCKTKTTLYAKGRFTFGHVQLRDYHGIFWREYVFVREFFFIEAAAFPEHGHQ